VITLTGTGRLVRLALRRDRILLPAWIASIALLTAGVVASVVGLYTSPEERAAAAAFGAANTVARVFDGIASGTSLGAMAMVEALLVLSVLVSLMSAQAVVRHTRLEEETGRAELVGSTVVGRHARLTAALLVAIGANLVVAGAVAAALVSQDLEVTGAVATGAALAALGIVFAGVAAVTAQVFSSARAANAAAGAVLAVSFLLRAIGDTAGRVAESGVEVISAWPSWLSPIGWTQQVRPFHQDNWEVLALSLGFATLLAAVAFTLTDHRDVGAGLLPTRPGPPGAAAGLRSAAGLAWRLQRGVVLGWAVGLVIGGAAFGAVGESAGDIMEISEQFADALRAAAPEGGLVELYFGFVVSFLGLAATGFTVQALLRMRAEEASGRLEPLLATAVGRSRWLASHVVIAAAGTVGLLALAGLAGVVAYGAATGDWGTGLRSILLGSLAQVPASLALGGFVVAAFAVTPRWASSLGWTALAISLVMGQLGALLELPQAALNLSPFTHVPSVVGAFEPLPLVLLTAAGLALAGLGAAVFARRDLVTAA
jgi:ABC-2 type transport system permease protein